MFSSGANTTRLREKGRFVDAEHTIYLFKPLRLLPAVFRILGTRVEHHVAPPPPTARENDFKHSVEAAVQPESFSALESVAQRKGVGWTRRRASGSSSASGDANKVSLLPAHPPLPFEGGCGSS